MFRHYFQRLSQRGWGRFTVDILDAGAGCGRIRLDNSIFALELGTGELGAGELGTGEFDAGTERRVCYMFEGFMTGAFRFLIGTPGTSAEVYCRETCCSAHDKSRSCQFEFGLVRTN